MTDTAMTDHHRTTPYPTTDGRLERLRAERDAAQDQLQVTTEMLHSALTLLEAAQAQVAALTQELAATNRELAEQTRMR